MAAMAAMVGAKSKSNCSPWFTEKNLQTAARSGSSLSEGIDTSQTLAFKLLTKPLRRYVAFWETRPGFGLHCPKGTCQSAGSTESTWMYGCCF